MASIPVRMSLTTVALGLLAGCAGFSNTAQPVPIDVPADFQLVNAPPYWDVENTSWVNNQHIDVTGVVKLNANSKQDLIPRRNFNTSTFTFNGSKTYSEFFSVENGSDYRHVIDINPAIVSVPLSKRVIAEQQVLSL